MGEDSFAPPHGGRLIARILKEHGIKYVFGIPGGHVWALDTGFYEHGIRQIHMRHQQAGGYAADAYARCTLAPGICYGTAGTGVTDSVSSINQAWRARSPVIGLFGMHCWDASGMGVLQEAYPSKVYETMTKWSVDIDNWRTISLYLRWALRDCMVYPPGPIVLGITIRALTKAQDEKGSIGDVPQKAIAYFSPTQADPAAVERAVAMLLEAERPVIVAGEGIHWADAAAELLEFVELLHIPVHTRRIARGAVPEDHPLTFSAGYRGDFWKEADVVMIIGLRLGWFEGYGLPPAWPARAKRIVIHEPATDGWSPVPTEEFIVGNPKSVLRQMIDCAENTMKEPPRRSAWLENLALCRDAFERGLAQDEAEYENHNPIHPWLLAREIAEFLDPSDTIILDSFIGSSYLADKVKARFPGQILDSGEAGGFGQGIGMGIGAQLARPGKQVFVLMGDAGMGVGGGDVETALRYNLPIVYLVCNTSSWFGGVDQWFEGQVDSWRMLPDIRYDRMYEALGCHGEHVTEAKEIRAALYRAFDSGKTAVINVVVDRRVMHPWFESAEYRTKVIARQLDLSKVPQPLRSYLLNGRTPEVEEELRKIGLPHSTRRKRVLI
ncbi:MAG: thiamine pyrophosphate-binding protein [Dehalococcoidia bacterium]